MHVVGIDRRNALSDAYDRFRNRLVSLGQLRDGLLLTAGVFYLFGYIVWSIHAFRNDLGLLPALDFQYFTAGIIPVLILLVLVVIVRLVRWLGEKSNHWFGGRSGTAKKILCWVMFVLGLLGLLVVLDQDGAWVQWIATATETGRMLPVIGLVLFMSSYLFLEPVASTLSSIHEAVDKRRGNWLQILKSLVSLPLSVALSFMRMFVPVYATILPVAMALAFWLIFVLEWYPQIPQEFGGARPRSACIDVLRSQISKETAMGILPRGATVTGDPVVRTERLQVLYSGGGVLLVRSRGRVYELAKGSVMAMTGCE